MTRFVLVPHANGFGHRVRCDAIGRALLCCPDVAGVHLLLRRDDSAPSANWTVLPITRSRIGRALRIISADVLVEDGFFFQNLAVRAMRLLGGKLVLIAQPTGFALDRVVRDMLEAADLVLVPYPHELFHPTPPLDAVIERVRIVDPIGGVGIVRRKPDAQHLVYFEVSRPLKGFKTIAEGSCSVLSSRTQHHYQLAGGFGELKSLVEHAEHLSRAQVVVTQGMSAAFEAIRLGIPVVLVPRVDVPEQMSTARELGAAGLATVVPPESLSSATLASAIQEAVVRPGRGRTVTRGRGASESVRLLREEAHLPARQLPTPWFSVISTNYNCGHALAQHLASIYRLWPNEEFEYVMVDNNSSDNSGEVLRDWAARHSNFRWTRTRCTVGKGRNLASRQAWGEYLLVVDTDTLYRKTLRDFVSRAVDEYPGFAVQAIYAGVFPHDLWRVSGGQGNFNVGEDFELWMRLWQKQRIKWYPARMGDNLKEPWARDSTDYLSARYHRREKLARLVRREFDLLRLARYDALDLKAIWKSEVVDFGLEPIQETWFGDSPKGNLRRRAVSWTKAVLEVLKS